MSTEKNHPENDDVVPGPRGYGQSPYIPAEEGARRGVPNQPSTPSSSPEDLSSSAGEVSEPETTRLDTASLQSSDGSESRAQGSPVSAEPVSERKTAQEQQAQASEQGFSQPQQPYQGYGQQQSYAHQESPLYSATTQAHAAQSYPANQQSFDAQGQGAQEYTPQPQQAQEVFNGGPSYGAQQSYAPAQQQEAYGYGPYQPAPASLLTGEGGLFDFSFRKFASPRLAKILFVLAIIAASSALLLGLIAGFAQFTLGPLGVLTGLVQIVVSIAAFLFAVILVRFFIELVLANVRTAELLEGDAQLDEDEENQASFSSVNSGTQGE